MQARFWVWHNDGFVRLKLSPGQAVWFETGGPTDEGYHHEYHYYLNEGDWVRYNYDTESRDCDGRLDTHQSFYCRVDRLDDIETDGPYVPHWVRLEARQRDYSAEAMGY